MSGRAERLAELVKSAVERGPESWAAFLDEECGSDPALRAEIESLLKQQEHVTRFIEAPALHLAAESFVRDGARREGQIIGDYEVLSLIGSGGMGEVYLAQDRRLHRKVALKLVRWGVDSDDIIRRFKREELLLASLNHPNIAQLYGSGMTADGIPFLAMEFVEGARVDAYSKEKKLSLQSQLELFRKVCSAIHYAHQHLVVHRDIKPSNILVTAEGEPKLLDFGIAKLVDADVARTITEMKALTPEYASPEQVKGENVTTATDVYSLGVVLYELLTAERPYRLKTSRADELSRVICEDEPERPSTAVGKHRRSNAEHRTQKLLRGDLDNIVLMAMRKEPARRYASVAQFSEDIRRHLVGLPVLARKDTWSYRSGKFVQRHKVGVAAASVVVLAIIAGLIGTLREKNRAERRFSDVRQLSNALLFDIAPKIERLEGSTEARASLVRRALEYLDSLAKESGNDAQLQGELAAAYEKVGELQGAPRKPNLSDYSGAITSYEKARGIRKRLFEQHPNDFEQLRRFAGDLSALSSIRWWISDTGGSLENSQRALDAYNKLLSAQPNSVDLQLAASEAQIDLANTYYYNDQLKQVYPPLEKAIATLEMLRQTDPENLEILRLLGRAYTSLSMTLSWDGKQSEAEVEMPKALAINESLVAKYSKDNVVRQGLLETYLQSSQLYEESNVARAFEILLKARAVAEEAVKNDAANTQARQNLAKTYSRLGLVALHLQRPEEAIGYLEQSSAEFASLEKIEPNRKTYKHDIGRVLMFLGQAYHQQKNFAAALAHYRKAATVFQEITAADPRNNLPIEKLANVYIYMGDAHRDFAAIVKDPQSLVHVQQAKENYGQALDIFSRLQAQQALTEYDRNQMEKLRATILKLEHN